MLRGLRYCLSLVALAALVSLAGCPKPTPPVVEEEEVKLPPDDASAVAAIEKTGAKIKKDESGHIVEIDFDPAGSDELLAEVAKLAAVRKVIAQGPNVTNAGVAHLKDMKSLKVLDLMQSSVDNDGLKSLESVPLEEINLMLTNVTDPGVEMLSKMKTLKRLKLIKTKVTDAGIGYVKNMPQLTVLDLQDVVTVTPACLESVKACKNLKFLRIYGNQFKEQGIAPIGEMTGLTNLSMEQTTVMDKDSKPNIKPEEINIGLLKTLVNLDRLSFFGTFVTDAGMAELSPLSKLTELDVRDTIVGKSEKPLGFLKHFPELKHLDLSETGTNNDGLANVVQLKKLEKLYLWHTKVNDEGAKYLAEMKSLTYLNLDDIQGRPGEEPGIGDAAMEYVAKLENLTFLHIGKTNVTDEGLAKLHALKKLETIHLTNLLQITDEGVAKLKEAIPALQKEGAIVR